MTRTNITAVDREAFDALVSGEYENFCLFSCFVNGKPASAICAIDDEQGNDSDECIVVPLFVSITDDMIITDHEGKVARGDLSSSGRDPVIAPYCDGLRPYRPQPMNTAMRP